MRVLTNSTTILLEPQTQDLKNEVEDSMLSKYMSMKMDPLVSRSIKFSDLAAIPYAISKCLCERHPLFSVAIIKSGDGKLKIILKSEVYKRAGVMGRPINNTHSLSRTCTYFTFNDDFIIEISALDLASNKDFVRLSEFFGDGKTFNVLVPQKSGENRNGCCKFILENVPILPIPESKNDPEFSEYLEWIALITQRCVGSLSEDPDPFLSSISWEGRERRTIEVIRETRPCLDLSGAESLPCSDKAIHVCTFLEVEKLGRFVEISNFPSTRLYG